MYSIRLLNKRLLIRSMLMNTQPACLVSKGVQDRFREVAEKVIGLEYFKGKTVIEVGASDFTFSNNLVGYGAKKVIAVEPSAIFRTYNQKILHVHDYLTKEHIQRHFPEADIVIMRHVLEHVSDPVDMLRDFGINLQIGSHVYLEVPNVEDIISKHRPYEFFYEHISYFSPMLLTSILRSFGFEIVKVTQLINGQHFGVQAKKVTKISKDSKLKLDCNKKLIANVDSFKSSIASFDKSFFEILKVHNKVAIYGAGGHTISLVTRLDITAKDIICLFDQSPVKIGKLAPVCKIPIVKPTEESVNTVNCIIIIASLHQDEISNDLRTRWNFNGELYGTYPSISKL